MIELKQGVKGSAYYEAENKGYFLLKSIFHGPTSAILELTIIFENLFGLIFIVFIIKILF